MYICICVCIYGHPSSSSQQNLKHLWSIVTMHLICQSSLKTLRKFKSKTKNIKKAKTQNIPEVLVQNNSMKDKIPKQTTQNTNDYSPENKHVPCKSMVGSDVFPTKLVPFWGHSFVFRGF